MLRGKTNVSPVAALVTLAVAGFAAVTLAPAEMPREAGQALAKGLLGELGSGGQYYRTAIRARHQEE